MLRAHGLACVRGDRRLFSDVDFSVSAGDWLQVEGANGAGKTSLLRIVAGLAQAADGHLEWDGQPVDTVRDEFNARLLYLVTRRPSRTICPPSKTCKLPRQSPGAPSTKPPPSPPCAVSA